MTQDEIIEITRQAGGFSPTPEFLEAFAKLVEDAAFVRWAAQTKLAVQEEREACFDAAMKAAEAAIDAAITLEREACLKICEQQASTNYWEGADVCAEAIRARGTNE